MTNEVQIFANFFATLQSIARAKSASFLPLDATDVPDDQIVRFVLDCRRKVPLQRLRSIQVADTFSVPLHKRNCWEKLKQKIVSGGDLRPHMSDKLAKAGFSDGSLNDWGVQHFHFDSLAYATKSQKRHRSPETVLAIVRDEQFFAVGVFGHRDWTNSSIPETICRNWPKLVEHRRLFGIASEKFSGQQRMAVRKKHVQITTCTEDGSVYAPFSGGITCDGQSFESLVESDRPQSRVEAIQKYFDEHPDDILKRIPEERLKDCRNISAKLGMDPDCFAVELPEIGVRIMLQGF